MLWIKFFTTYLTDAFMSFNMGFTYFKSSTFLTYIFIVGCMNTYLDILATTRTLNYFCFTPGCISLFPPFLVMKFCSAWIVTKLLSWSIKRWTTVYTITIVPIRTSFLIYLYKLFRTPFNIPFIVWIHFTKWSMSTYFRDFNFLSTIFTHTSIHNQFVFN